MSLNMNPTTVVARDHRRENDRKKRPDPLSPWYFTMLIAMKRSPEYKEMMGEF